MPKGYKVTKLFYTKICPGFVQIGTVTGSAIEFEGSLIEVLGPPGLHPGTLQEIVEKRLHPYLQAVPALGVGDVGLAPEGASQTKKFCLQVIKKRPRKKFCLQVI
ncbi:hypothetical protein EVAR_6509_1 [Eumeta japonica]|uniref:Uncharacterized protein n=1 Tax=Eumeta variegata TaxID=151549 RepID=A0A4C1STB4_EUMVA|nr:hypothetical protein EVAR_6509_1 [Eumeta japonica]